MAPAPTLKWGSPAKNVKFQRKRNLCELQYADMSQPKTERGVDLVLDLDERIQHHGAALTQINLKNRYRN